MKPSILTRLMLPQSERAPEENSPPATPEGLSCMGCSHCGAMCDRTCRSKSDKKQTVKHDGHER